MSTEFNSLGDIFPLDDDPGVEGMAKQELIYCIQQIADDLGEQLHANKYLHRDLEYSKLYELEQKLVKIITRFS